MHYNIDYEPPQPPLLTGNEMETLARFSGEDLTPPTEADLRRLQIIPMQHALPALAAGLKSVMERLAKLEGEPAKAAKADKNEG